MRLLLIFHKSFYNSYYLLLVNRNFKHLHKATDEALVSCFVEDGNLEILGLLYERYMPLVYGVSLKYLKQREKCQDAVMQIFELLIKEIPKHEISIFKSWLYGVTRNYCLMQLRSANTQKSKAVIFSSEVFMESTASLHPIDDTTLLMNTKEAALRECLKQLKSLQKDCVTAFFYEKKCYQEIAEVLHIQEKKVKSNLQNGKRNLKLCLEDRLKNK